MKFQVLIFTSKIITCFTREKGNSVGGQRDIEIVRVLAVNRDMVTEVNNLDLEDLYYRLNVFPLQTKNLKDEKVFFYSFKILKTERKKYQ